jgi:hypothetical protein
MFCMFEPLHRGLLSTCVPSQPNVFAPLWNHPSINTVPLTPPLFASPVQIQLKDSKHACMEIPFYPDILYRVWNKVRRECDRTNEYCGRDKNCWGWGGILYRHMKHVHNTRVQKYLYSWYFTKRVTAADKGQFEKTRSCLRSENNYISKWVLM